MPKIKSALQNDSIQYFGFVAPWYGINTRPVMVYWSKYWLEGIKTAEEVAILFLRYLHASYYKHISAIDVGLYNSPIYLPEIDSEWETDLTIANMGIYNPQRNDLRPLLLEAIGQDHLTLHKLVDINNHPDVTPCSYLVYKSDSKAHFLDFNYDDYDNFDASKLKYQGVFGIDTGDNLIFDMWQAIVPPSDNRYVTSYLGKLNWTPIGIDANGNYTMTFK